ncbi:MAG: hypothetical protein Aurels2KO_13960 [Aureliella sp.]
MNIANLIAKKSLRGSKQRKQSRTNRAITLENLENRKLLAASIASAPEVDIPAIYDMQRSSPAPRIVNGQQTSSFEAVGVVNDGCSGTLISPTHVLTAAHCTVGMDVEEMSFEVDGKRYDVAEVHDHPRYNDDDFGAGFDISILTLSEPVEGVEPMAIFRGTPEVGDKLTLVGFGQGGTSRDPSFDFGTKRVGETAIDGVTDRHITWKFDSHDESNTAPGDSGGPAFLKVGGELQIAGITSGGDGDPHSLGDNSFDTRVDTLADWIDGVVGQTNDGGGNDNDDGSDDGGDDGVPADGDDHVNVIGDQATEMQWDEFGAWGEGVLEESGDKDVFVMQLDQADSYEIYLQSAEEDIDTKLSLSDSDGNTIAMTGEVGSLADSLIIRNLDEGTYYLTVESAGDFDTGAYFLDVYGGEADGDFGGSDFGNDGWGEDDDGDLDDFWGGVGEGGDDWWNGMSLSQRCDVNQDQFVSPQDVLQIINTLNNPSESAQRGRQMQDVSRDGVVSPLDALLVINMLNRQSDSVGEGESDASPQQAAHLAGATAIDFSSLDRRNRDAAFGDDAEWLS